MKRKIISLALACALLLGGCSEELEDEWFDEDDIPSETTASEPADEENPIQAAAQNYGTGLENFTINGAPDENPDRKISKSRTPIRQARAINVNGEKLSDDFYFYRNVLSTRNKQAYDQIYAALYRGSDTVNMNVPVHYSEISDIVFSVFYDHPELFWMENSVNYYYNNNGEVTQLTIGTNDTAGNLRAYQQAFESAVTKVLVKANTFSTDIEKVKYVHDYLTNTIDYVYNSPLNQSAYSALVLGKTVCAGYAKAFQYCMQKLGIPAAYIVGYAGELHAWNLVKLDGEYYNMDVTWDDPISNPPTTYYYNYFNITDSAISSDHSRDELSQKLPSANGTKYNYYSWFGDSAGSDFNDWNAINGVIPTEYGHETDESGNYIAESDYTDITSDNIDSDNSANYDDNYSPDDYSDFSWDDWDWDDDSDEWNWDDISWDDEDTDDWFDWDWDDDDWWDTDDLDDWDW